MKKIFFGLAALMLSMTVLAERVSQDDAALVANNFMNVGNTVSGVQKAPAKKMVLKKAATASENQYYVYENANGEGWVMVAANDVAHPILAYSETGHFRTDNQPTNLKTWLDGYDRQILKAEKAGLVAPASIQKEWSALRSGARKATAATPVVSPLIKTGWDQDAPFWNLCPTKSSEHVYTGCVATAMAQVMNYHQWPKQGTGSHSIKFNSKTYTVNFGTTTYDWDNMLDRYDSGNPTTAQKNAVATLMYHCGVAVDMQYGTADEGGSAAYTIDYNGYWSGKGTMCAETALKQFFGYNAETIKGYYRDGDSDEGMKSWTKSEWIAMLKVELDAARPIMYAGGGCDDPDDEETCYGHSFVCDGYDSQNYFHFNFGWTNWCDGYYDVDALETTDPGSGGGNGSYSLDQDVIVGIMPPALGPDVNVTWMANGVAFDNTVATHGVLALPAENPEACENGKKFVGWTATEDYESDDAPSFAQAGTILDEDATFYAVYATQEGEGTPVSTTTYTFNSKSWGDSQNAWNSDKDVNQYVSDKQGVQVTSSLSGAGATTKEALSNVSKVVVKYCTNASSGAGSITVKVGTASKVLEITKTDGTTLRDLEFAFDNASGKVSFEVTCTTNSIYINSVAITSGGGLSYAGYTTSCGTTPEPVYYSIRFFNNGKQIGETQNVLKNQQADVPTGITAECEDYTFVGWWTAELPANNQVAQTWVTNFKATKDQDYYAIFSKTEEGAGGSAPVNTTLTMEDYAAPDGTFGAFTFTAGGSGTAAAYNATGKDARYYASNTLTIAAESEMTKIVFNLSAQGLKRLAPITANEGTIAAQASGDTKVIWTGSATSVTFTVGAKADYGSEGSSKAGQLDFTSVDITTGGGAPAATTYYSSVVTCGETAIDNNVVAPKAIKVLENGQIVIILGDQKYTIFGQKIQ